MNSKGSEDNNRAHSISDFCSAESFVGVDWRTLKTLKVTNTIEGCNQERVSRGSASIQFFWYNMLYLKFWLL